MEGERKSELLRLLRESGEPVSGEAASRILGLSRVAVWKHIRSLKEHGYGVVSSARGYRLEADGDFLFPWEFPDLTASVHYHGEIASTMEDARILADGESPHGTLVVAERQTRGRGRAGRSWLSETGGLYFTRIERRRLPVALSSRLLLAASLAIAHTLERLYGLEARLKWPNDVLLGDRKIAGMLGDTRAEGAEVHHINLGVGINVNNSPGLLVPSAVSVAELIGRNVSRRELLSALVEEMDRRSGHLEGEELIGEWKSRSATIGRNVEVITPGGVIKGRAVDIDESGALLVRTPEAVSKVYMGDCTHRNDGREGLKLHDRDKPRGR